MRKALFSVLIVGVVMMTASMAMAVKPGPCLPDPPSPDDFACTDDGASVEFTWGAIPLATKYSVDVEVGDAEYSFSAVTSPLSVDFSEFDTCGTGVAKVKGLNPPQKGNCSQNNPFWSGLCVFQVPCATVDPVP